MSKNIISIERVGNGWIFRDNYLNRVFVFSDEDDDPNNDSSMAMAHSFKEGVHTLFPELLKTKNNGGLSIKVVPKPQE